jgi:hypothetical protein
MTEKAACDFSEQGYRDLLVQLFAKGYVVRSYETAKTNHKNLILRHDIDMSITAAVRLAKIEREINVKATYFVLLRSEFYNPFSPESLRMLSQLRDYGHELGLHLDASLYCDDRDALEIAARDECQVLEKLIETPVRTISFHRPARSLIGLEGTLAGRNHAYAPTYFSKMGYCSDSRGAWHHDHPLMHPAVNQGEALQLLTHPIWWVGPQGTPEERLNRFLNGRTDLLDFELARQCDVHQLSKRY